MSKKKMLLARAKQRARKEKRRGLRRMYEIDDRPFTGIRKYLCPMRSCCFCDNCTDVYWDFTNGIYMFECIKNRDTRFGYLGQCRYFRKEKEDAT